VGVPKGSIVISLSRIGPIEIRRVIRRGIYFIEEELRYRRVFVYYSRDRKRRVFSSNLTIRLSIL